MEQAGCSKPGGLLQFLRLGYEKKTTHRGWSFFIVEAGFEPTTLCLEGRCSIQLSYSTILLSQVWREYSKNILFHQLDLLFC